ncbi:hypothetical protein O0L34_g910 [Tuta absoluta]|nr:hypothetical protein O0L34_g910 [Tuta absoluta]
MSGCVKFILLRASIWKEFCKNTLITLTQVRTHSKPKPNKIEALRKKYEALLQEDKRRKERNEYILEKMDNMRTCNALVPTKHRSFIQGNASGLLTSSNHLAPVVGASVNPANQFYQNFHQKVPFMPSNGSAVSLLKDIYNKYILIPKRQPDNEQTIPQNFDEANIATNITAAANNFEISSDWKSKYEILDKIKQDEKECIGNDGLEFNSSVRQQENFAYPKQFEQEIPEKDNNNTVTLNKDINGQKLSKGKNLIHCKNHKEKQTSSDSGDTNSFPSTKIEGSEKIEHLDDEGINPAHISYSPQNIGKPFGDIPNVTEDVQYPLDVINVEEFTPNPNVIVQDGVNVNPKDGLNKDHFESHLLNEEEEKDYFGYDKGNVHVNEEEYDTQQYYQKSQSHKVEDSSETDKMYPNEQSENTEMAIVSEMVNGNPQNIQSTLLSFNESQSVPLTKHTEDLGNPSAETDVTLDTEAQAVCYPESITEVAYGPSVTADETWDNTKQQNIQQNDQYYYEGPHEMPESVHINEHEETNTQYDQNYEQQYDAANHEQQQYNLSQVGYDESAGLESQQVYDESGQAVYDQSGQAVYDQSGHAVYDQSEQLVYDQTEHATYNQNEHSAYDQSEHAVYDQSEHAVYDQSEHAVYDQSEHAVYDQNENAEYDQSEHAGYEQQPMEHYNQEHEAQPYLQDNYEQVEHIEEQLNKEEGYVVPQNEQVEQLNVENQQQQPQVVIP